jgi:calcineurin-like phosphoesterase family protein
MSLKIHDKNKVWFTSDLHLNHKNIIKYCNRPFISTQEMNEKLIENWNSVVKPDDHVFNLGDFCFGEVKQWQEFRNQLNGKITLIKGNHDKLQNGQIQSLFDGVYDYLKISVKDEDTKDGWQKIILCHYALRTWEGFHRKSFSLYGHSHGTLPDDPNLLSIDVGVDCHEYKPISYNEVKEIMKKKNFVPIDHHC